MPKQCSHNNHLWYDKVNILQTQATWHGSQSEETYTKLKCKSEVEKQMYDAKVNSKLMVLLGKVL